MWLNLGFISEGDNMDRRLWNTTVFVLWEDLWPGRCRDRDS